MGLMKKLKFWKKGEELGLGDDVPADPGAMPDSNLGLESPGSEFPEQNLGLDKGLEQPTGVPTNVPTGVDNPTGFQELNQQQHAQSLEQPVVSNNKDFDLISSKLDTIKAELDSISQRLQKIEKIAEQSQKESKKPIW